MANLRTRIGIAELRTAIWIVHGSIDPLQTLAGARTTPGADRFSLRIAAGRGPIEALFVFTPGAVCGGTLPFDWTHEGDAFLPSMSGTIGARRFGPIVVLSVRAHYSCGYDLPGRLFVEAIGSKLARRTFTALRHALVHMLQHLPSHSIYEMT